VVVAEEGRPVKAIVVAEEGLRGTADEAGHDR
jgi:hypothetical protein